MSQFMGSKQLQAIAARNTKSTLIAYAVPVLFYSGLVHFLALTSTPYWVYILLYGISATFILMSMSVIGRISNFTPELGVPLLYTQLAFWLVVSHVWLFTLEEGRSGGLLFALSMLVYTFAYGTAKMALLLNSLIVVGYLSVSYVGIHLYGQPGSMTREVTALAAYLPVSLLVGRVGSKLAIGKRHMKTMLAEQSQMQQQLTETLTKLEQVADTDELTGLMNRRALNRVMNYEYQQIQRGEPTGCLVILDLDYFKKINDTYGHNCGDEVLKHVAQWLTGAVRSTDSVARWGGEEFFVFMPNTCLAEARAVVERVIQIVREQRVTYRGQVLQLTVSAGLEVLNHLTSIQCALNVADERLYQAKAQGRDQLVWQSQRPERYVEAAPI